MTHRHLQPSRRSISRWVLLLCFFVVAGALPLFAATTKITNTSSGKVVVQQSRAVRAANAVANRFGRATTAIGNIWRARGDRAINLGPSNPAGGTQVTASGAVNNVTSGTAVGRATSGMGLNGTVGPVNATIDVDADEIFNNDLGQSVAAGPVTKTGAAQAISSSGGGVAVVGGAITGAVVFQGNGVAAAPATATGIGTGVAGPGAVIGVAGPPSTLGGQTAFVSGSGVTTSPVITTSPVVVSNGPSFSAGVVENAGSTSGGANANVILGASGQTTTQVGNVTVGGRARGVRTGTTTAPVRVGGGTISVPSRGLTMRVTSTPSH